MANPLRTTNLGEESSLEIMVRAFILRIDDVRMIGLRCDDGGTGRAVPRTDERNSSGKETPLLGALGRLRALRAAKSPHER